MRCLHLALILPILLSACQPAAREPVHSPDLVTVFGPLGQYDRGAMQAEDEPLFAAYGLEFPRALGLAASDLSGFELLTVTTDFPLGGDQHSFSGPRLRDVLAFAGAANQTIRVTALDGYQREIAPERYLEHDVILALRQDGKAMGIGGRGPVMLVWPRGTDPALDGMNDDDWVFAIFAIEVVAD